MTLFGALKKAFKDWKGELTIKKKLQAIYSEMIQSLDEVRLKLKDLSGTNFDLGVYHLQNGNVKDALIRFRILKRFKSTNPLVDYYLCHCYVDLFNFNDALKYFELYQSSGDQTFATEMQYYELLLKNKEIKEVPGPIIRDKFNQLATKYDAFHKKMKENSPQTLLCNELLAITSHQSQSEVIYNKPFGNNILDLGCGTGIIGSSLRQSGIANFIIGIDISEKMTSIAKARVVSDQPSYSQVINKDIRDFFSASNSEYNAVYDIVIMSDFLTYFSDLEFIMNGLDSMTHQNSILALTFKSNTNKPFEYIRSIGEFYYSPNFIQEIMMKKNWKMIAAKEIFFIGKNPGNLMFYMKK